MSLTIYFSKTMHVTRSRRDLAAIPTDWVLPNLRGSRFLLSVLKHMDCASEVSLSLMSSFAVLTALKRNCAVWIAIATTSIPSKVVVSGGENSDTLRDWHMAE
ncbi:hypothetical protein BDV95DRAFT_154973 [Massariosphaeria phaeospora]|uniref:Uncharacterized protein n=1 Tax=Massariosphaeria phaeospora TaxID=100035 RepID=A0A7C8II19_9PLEO|nr:hypothetical protein BDV95DRAFT_154973 [Massariosphaeria phaeospora]